MISQFAESLKRLFRNKMITKEKILELCKNKKITDDETKYILDI